MTQPSADSASWSHSGTGCPPAKEQDESGQFACTSPGRERFHRLYFNFRSLRQWWLLKFSWFTSNSWSLVVTLKGRMLMSSSPSGGAPAPHQPSSVFRTWVLLLWARYRTSPPIQSASSTSANMLFRVRYDTGLIDKQKSSVSRCFLVQQIITLSYVVWGKVHQMWVKVWLLVIDWSNRLNSPCAEGPLFALAWALNNAARNSGWVWAQQSWVRGENVSRRVETKVSVLCPVSWTRCIMALAWEGRENNVTTNLVLGPVVRVGFTTYNQVNWHRTSLGPTNQSPISAPLMDQMLCVKFSRVALTSLELTSFQPNSITTQHQGKTNKQTKQIPTTWRRRGQTCQFACGHVTGAKQ